jgi:hypothetical protein
MDMTDIDEILKGIYRGALMINFGAHWLDTEQVLYRQMLALVMERIAQWQSTEKDRLVVWRETTVHHIDSECGEFNHPLSQK